MASKNKNKESEIYVNYTAGVKCTMFCKMSCASFSVKQLFYHKVDIIKIKQWSNKKRSLWKISWSSEFTFDPTSTFICLFVYLCIWQTLQNLQLRNININIDITIYNLAYWKMSFLFLLWTIIVYYFGNININ